MTGPESGYIADWRRTVHNKTATEVMMKQQTAGEAFDALIEHRLAAIGSWRDAIFLPDFMLPLEPEPTLEKQEPPPLDGPVFGL